MVRLNYLVKLILKYYIFKRGSCPCKELKTCEDPNENCNCDKPISTTGKEWSSDEGEFKDPQALGITTMYFKQQKNLEDDSKGRITLGPLKCIETSK